MQPYKCSINHAPRSNVKHTPANMKEMEALLIGYFPKKTALRPDYLHAPNVTEICSVSTCISKGPEQWLEYWRHNEYFLYNTPEDALSVIGDLSNRQRYDIYAYKQYPLVIESGEVVQEQLLEVKVTKLSKSYEFLGYDAVNKTFSDAFECSPLSCNGGAETIKTNKYCLFDTYGDAMVNALRFSIEEKWESGKYYIIEVYRDKNEIR